MNLDNIPSPNEMLKRYGVNVANVSGAFYEPLYDYQTKTLAATVEQRFFVDPVGTSGKTLSDTNMELSGQMAAGTRFAVMGIQVELYPDAPINGTASAAAFAADVYAFYKTGALILTIGSTQIIRQGNLMKFAPVNRLEGFAAVTTTAAATTNNQLYATAAGREFKCNNLVLVAGQNFSVTLLNTAATSTTCRVGITLNGIKYRNAQ